MLLRTIAGSLLSVLLLACAAKTTGSTPDGTSSENEPAAPGDTSVFSVSCDGTLSKLAVPEIGVTPKCLGAAPGTNCGGDGGAPLRCRPQDVKLYYAPPAMRCVGIDVYEWDGLECVAHNTQGEGGSLKCTGKDCEKLFKSKDECEAQACYVN